MHTLVLLGLGVPHPHVFQNLLGQGMSGTFLHMHYCCLPAQEFCQCSLTDLIKEGITMHQRPGLPKHVNIELVRLFVRGFLHPSSLPFCSSASLC